MEDKVLVDLKKIVQNGKIVTNEPMSKHTSFKTGGPADYFISVSDIDEVAGVVKYSKENSIPLYILGNGSNLLVLDEGIRGIVLKIELDKFKVEKKDNSVFVYAEAGCKIMALAQYFAKNGISGFEELSGIPGTIGGANLMNAGAYGKEMKDIIVETKVLDKQTGEILVLSNSEQELVYRGSIFKDGKYVILETVLCLGFGDSSSIEEKMNEYASQRKEKQPIEYHSAGSTFKRGDGFITAKLIDECGIKGYSIGGAQISEKHAGFIINKGNATSKDILELIEYTKKKVFEKFNVEIQEEVEIIGK